MTDIPYLGKRRRIKASRATGNAEIWNMVNEVNHRISEADRLLKQIRAILERKVKKGEALNITEMIEVLQTINAELGP
jgi:hypothetical protein